MENQKQDNKKEAPTGKFKDIIAGIEDLSAKELGDFIDILKNDLGITDAQPTTATLSAAEEKPEEKALFTVTMTSSGPNLVNAIKAIRVVLPDMGLKQSKDFVESAPQDVKENLKKDDAESLKNQLEEAGMTIEIK